MKKKYKTEGLEWLEHSFTAFNGSGYADIESPEDFVDSYIDYNKWKKRFEAVKLATQYYAVLLNLAEHFIDVSEGASHVPSDKNLAKFQASRSNVRLFD